MFRLRKQDSEFRYSALSYINFHLLDMDRVLTAFLPRLKHDGFTSRVAGPAKLTVDHFANEFFAIEDAGEGFQGFSNSPDITRRWLETNLVDMVNRGRPTQAIAGLRPLHGKTYFFRNSKHSRPSGADEQLYEMLTCTERGRKALRQLQDFFFQGLDRVTDTPLLDQQIDVETQALITFTRRLSNQISDGRSTNNSRQPYRPLCTARVELLADDVLRLMYHHRHIPRSVMVEYLKILFAFHLALHHLWLLRAVPAMIERGHVAHECRFEAAPEDSASGGFSCELDVGLFADVAGVFGTPAAKLATRSAQVWQDRIPAYIRGGYEIRKLSEFAANLVNKRELTPPSNKVFPVDTLLSLRDRKHAEDREAFFASRMHALLDTSKRDDGSVPDEMQDILDLGLDDYTAYVEILMAYKGRFHRRYFNECLDSLMLKNRPGALIAQPRGNPRRFILDSRLIEVLLQISLLRPSDGGGFHTEALRVDEFLSVLSRRYGIHVDRLPERHGFASPGIDDHAALRENTRAFTDRLREIGFYSDLSDAYLTQTITPRYRIERESR